MEAEQPNSADYDLFHEATDRHDINKDIGLLQEDYCVLFGNQEPINSQLTDFERPNQYNTFVTVDSACHQLWDQAKKEIKFVQEKGNGFNRIRKSAIY
jgi:hypothetical protein